MPHFSFKNRQTGNTEIFEAKHKQGKYRPHSGAKEQAKAAKRAALAAKKNPQPTESNDNEQS